MYYFISYIAKIQDGHQFMWLPENAVINQHPIEWLVEVRNEFPDIPHFIVNWNEITEQVYNQFKDEL